jgi:iron complex transport system ATP-binding protein
MGLTMMSHHVPLLSTTALDVGFATASEMPLFQNLNLTLHPGKLICFMGPNGVGKSTLIRTLAGLQKPLRGTVSIHPDKTTEHAIALVLTDKLASSNMTALELVTYGRYPYLDWNIRLSNTDRTIINQAMEATRVAHLQNKKLHELSDGQLQMVLIARALAQETPILLLDEPTAHLDLNNRVEIMNLLRKTAREKNKAILVATHELDLALQTADWIWLAGENRSLLNGIPEDLVLNGSFDTIFQLKGFDLKTGKVQHEAYRESSVRLEGEGPEYLWTKNALERNGFMVSVHGSVRISINKEESNITWTVNHERRCKSIAELVSSLAGSGKNTEHP